MKSNRKNAFLAALTASLLFCFAPTTFATIAPITAGQNGTGGGEHLQIPWTTEGGSVGEWLVGNPSQPTELIADPTAPPMVKWFLSPTDGPLEAGWSAPVWEFFSSGRATRLSQIQAPRSPIGMSTFTSRDGCGTSLIRIQNR